MIILSLLLTHLGAPASEPMIAKGVRTINERQVKAQVEFLSCDSLRGRAAGSSEAVITAQYIASTMYGYGYNVEHQTFFVDSIKTKSGMRAVGQLTNILCTLKGIDTTKNVVIGAHFDHLGVDKQGQVFNGADDNASGVVAVLQIARAFKESGIQPKYNIIFAFWDAEEIGSIGSKHYLSEVAHHNLPIISYMNFDMVGRNTDESRPAMFRYFYTESSPQFEKWLREAITTYSLNLDPDYRAWDKPTTGSDNAPFARQGIPIVWFHTDAHPDYHRVSDTADKINYPKLTDIIRAAFTIVVEMAR